MTTNQQSAKPNVAPHLVSEIARATSFNARPYMHAPGALTFTPPTQFGTKVAMATEVARAPPSRASLQQHSSLEGVGWGAV